MAFRVQAHHPLTSTYSEDLAGAHALHRFEIGSRRFRRLKRRALTWLDRAVGDVDSLKNVLEVLFVEVTYAPADSPTFEKNTAWVSRDRLTLRRNLEDAELFDAIAWAIGSRVVYALHLWPGGWPLVYALELAIGRAFIRDRFDVPLLAPKPIEEFTGAWLASRERHGDRIGQLIERVPS